MNNIKEHEIGLMVRSTVWLKLSNVGLTEWVYLAPYVVIDTTPSVGFFNCDLFLIQNYLEMRI